VPQFDQPSYSAILGHYASHNLTDETRILKNGYTSRVRSSDILAANGRGRPVVDEALLNRLLEFADKETSREPATWTVGAMASAMAETGLGVARRHILWLIKYGFLGIS
jgi:hypothetical protein